MPRKIGKTPVQRIRFSRELFERLKAAKKASETWEEFLLRIFENYENTG